MKHIICVLFCLTLNSVFAQSQPEHRWNATLRVVDEIGTPVAGAKIKISYDMSTNLIVGLTDTNGMFTASRHGDSVDLAFLVDKPGYYHSRINYHLGFDYDPAIWNPAKTIVLKKIGQPIAMYAKRLNTHVPALDKPVGFDLIAGDWVRPYGNGKNTDMLFTVHLDQRSENDYDYKLHVSFPNSGDGIQLLNTNTIGQDSELQSPHDAPESNYEPQLVKVQGQKPGEPIKDEGRRDFIYFFRVRTVLDENGKVKSALYGKIYGDFMRFTYYLNPTPNSRNVEFDPKRNLMKNLKPLEGVEAP